MMVFAGADSPIQKALLLLPGGPFPFVSVSSNADKLNYH